MHRIITSTVASCLLGLVICGPASANFRLQNHSNETISAHVLLTQVFSSGRVDQLPTVTLKPGQSYDFITNDVVPGRVLYLFLYSHSSGKFFFEAHPQASFSIQKHHGHVVNTPYWEQAFNNVGNKYVASAASSTDFTPLLNTRGGAKFAKALRIVPKAGGHKAVQLRYKGMSNGFVATSW